jgi:hypothetical protein
MQLRFDELTRERYKAQRGEQAAKAEAERLQRELEALKATNKPAETKVEPVAEFVFDKPQPKETDFEDFTSFTDALTDWKIERADAKKAHEAAKKQADTERAAAEAERQAREAAQSKDADERAAVFQGQIEAVKAKYEDFDQAVEQSGHIEIPMVARAAIEDSEIGGEVLYFLLKHPEEIEKIKTLTPGRIVKRIGQIEAKVEADLASQPADDEDETEETPAPAPRKVPVSKAPEPISDVRGSAAAVNKPLDQVPYAEFVRRRNAEIAKRGRRF